MNHVPAPRPDSRGRRSPLLRRLVATLVTLLILAGFVSPADAYPGAPWFRPDSPYDQNFPDPAIILVDDTYYAYSTATGGSSMPVMTSSDLETWIAHGDALGSGPSWSPRTDGKWTIWAPTVVELPTGDFLAAFASSTGEDDRRCIATLTAPSPRGPFVALGSEPFVCEPDPNGALDPFLIVDDADVPWLIWKNEGVPVGHPTLASRRTAFWSRQLTDDGTAWRSGSTKNFLMETTERIRPWQGNVVENPAMVAWKGSFLLAYSANQWDSIDYAIGWARCETPAGPCTEHTTEPLLVSNAERSGPGGPAPFVDRDGVLRLGYHGWKPPYTSYPPYPECRTGSPRGCEDGQRYLFIDIVCTAGMEVSVLNPREGARFCDVPVDAYYATPVADLHAEGVLDGTLCEDGFCPWKPIDRKTMAVWTVRVLDGQDPPPITRSRFDDVDPASFHARFIERMADLGVTSGCGDGSGFCPDLYVSRAHMAVFLSRAYSLPDGPAPGFTDVPDDAWYAPDVAKLAASGITAGCADGLFCPSRDTARREMATFLHRAETAEVSRG